MNAGRRKARAPCALPGMAVLYSSTRCEAPSCRIIREVHRSLHGRPVLARERPSHHPATLLPYLRRTKALGQWLCVPSFRMVCLYQVCTGCRPIPKKLEVRILEGFFIHEKILFKTYAHRADNNINEV
jgi:hypothetical protein